MNEIISINGVECYEKDGTAYLKLEAVARGLGFTQVKNGVEYVKWERVGSYLAELGFSPQVGKDGFIPENIFYRLAMKAKNEVAEAFQAKVADEIIPAIRKHGGYLTQDKVEEALLNPDVLIRLATDLKNEREARRIAEEEKLLLQQKNEVQAVLIEKMQPKVSYYDKILQSKSAVSVTQIAKDYGMSAVKFNSTLHELGVQYKQGDMWVLYQKYTGKGYTKSKTYVVSEDVSKMGTYWTQNGRKFLYDLLKENGIYPECER